MTLHKLNISKCHNAALDINGNGIHVDIVYALTVCVTMVFCNDIFANIGYGYKKLTHTNSIAIRTVAPMETCLDIKTD